MGGSWIPQTSCSASFVLFRSQAAQEICPPVQLRSRQIPQCKESALLNSKAFEEKLWALDAALLRASAPEECIAKRRYSGKMSITTTFVQQGAGDSCQPNAFTAKT